MKFFIVRKSANFDSRKSEIVSEHNSMDEAEKKLGEIKNLPGCFHAIETNPDTIPQEY